MPKLHNERKWRCQRNFAGVRWQRSMNQASLETLDPALLWVAVLLGLVIVAALRRAKVSRWCRRQRGRDRERTDDELPRNAYRAVTSATRTTEK